MSPYEIMQVITGKAAIKIDRPDFHLDGGNLLRLTDGRLLTTKDLFLANRQKEAHLTEALKENFGLRDIVYLESLPGPVIKHVDMFVLPAVGKRILLASYDGANTSNPYLASASEAMKQNKDTLTRLGYEVVDVPALPPAYDANRVYYPTNLNALSLRKGDGAFLVLVPFYPQFDPYLQFNGYKMSWSYLQLFNIWSATCSPRTVYAYSVGQPWNVWDAMPWAGPGLSQYMGELTQWPGPSCSNWNLNHDVGEWMVIPIDVNVLNSWVNGTSPNYGISVVANTWLRSL